MQRLRQSIIDKINMVLLKSTNLDLIPVKDQLCQRFKTTQTIYMNYFITYVTVVVVDKGQPFMLHNI